MLDDSLERTQSQRDIMSGVGLLRRSARSRSMAFPAINSMKPTPIIRGLSVSLLAAFLLIACQNDASPVHQQNSSASMRRGSVNSSLPENIDPDEHYLFYLHGKIIEDEGVDAVSPQFGAYEFQEILNYLADGGFQVIGEVRTAPTDVIAYADRVVAQVNSLLERGVPSENIAIVGFSKGAAIAIQASMKLGNPDLNFVLIAICGEEANRGAGLALAGRFLSLYERSDELGSSCRPMIEGLPDVKEFEEIEFATGKQHGAFYSADPSWLDPLMSWLAGK